jgi:hypothetical protein
MHKQVFFVLLNISFFSLLTTRKNRCVQPYQASQGMRVECHKQFFLMQKSHCFVSIVDPGGREIFTISHIIVYLILTRILTSKTFIN